MYKNKPSPPQLKRSQIRVLTKIGLFSFQKVCSKFVASKQITSALKNTLDKSLLVLEKEVGTKVFFDYCTTFLGSSPTQVRVLKKRKRCLHVGEGWNFKFIILPLPSKPQIAVLFPLPSCFCSDKFFSCFSFRLVGESEKLLVGIKPRLSSNILRW